MSCISSFARSLQRRILIGLMIWSSTILGCGYQWSGRPQVYPSGSLSLKSPPESRGASSRPPQGHQSQHLHDRQPSQYPPISVQNLTLISGLEWIVQEGLDHPDCSRIEQVKLKLAHPSLPIGFAGQSRVNVHILSARVIYIGETGEQVLNFKAPLMSAYTAIGAPLPTSRAAWVEATTRLTAQMSSLCSTGHR
jgi:hypothetical protein